MSKINTNTLIWKITKYFTLPLLAIVIVIVAISPAQAKAEFEGYYYNWIEETQRSGTLIFTVKNVSDVSGVAECSIILTDKESYLVTTSEIPAGEKRRYNLDMVITEGFVYADTLDIDCEVK